MSFSPVSVPRQAHVAAGASVVHASVGETRDRILAVLEAQRSDVLVAPARAETCAAGNPSGINY
jgi:hypothetical protein